jgi:hypothetical protein
MARPTKYKPEYVEQVTKLGKLGATDKEIADFFGVAESTLNKWKIDHLDFFDAMNSGKLLADAAVADSLFRRAIGYSHPEDDIRTVAMGGNLGSEIVITSTTKHYPPDTTACIFWLKNRRIKSWRSMPDPNSGEDDLPPTKVIFEVRDARSQSRKSRAE